MNSREKKRPTAHFNSRPSARGDGILMDFLRKFSNFNSRPSARGDGRWAMRLPGR